MRTTRHSHPRALAPPALVVTVARRVRPDSQRVQGAPEGRAHGALVMPVIDALLKAARRVLSARCSALLAQRLCAQPSACCSMQAQSSLLRPYRVVASDGPAWSLSRAAQLRFGHSRALQPRRAVRAARHPCRRRPPSRGVAESTWRRCARGRRATAPSPSSPPARGAAPRPRAASTAREPTSHGRGSCAPPSRATVAKAARHAVRAVCDATRPPPLAHTRR